MWSRRGRFLGRDSEKQIRDGIGNVLSRPIVDGAAGPRNAELVRRPNAEKRLLGGQVEPKFRREARIRRTDYMNKELANDLGSGMTIKIGRQTIWGLGGPLVRKHKKGSR
jgi:hypothetical protein